MQASVSCIIFLAAYAVGVSATVGWTNGNFGDGSMSGSPLGTTTLGTRAFISGGSNRDHSPVPTVLAYDSSNAQWYNYSTALNPPRARLAAVTVGRKVIFVGGKGDAEFYSAATIYDADANTWTNVPNALAANRTVAVACTNAANTKALFWGGQTTGFLNWQTPDVYDGTNWAPVTLPSNFIARGFNQAAIGGRAGPDHCVLVGGENAQLEGMLTADIYTFSTGVLRSNVSGLIRPRGYAASASYGNRLLIAGGTDLITGLALDSIEYYDAGTDSWGMLSVVLSVGRNQFNAVATPDGQLVFFVGGYSNSVYHAVVDMYNVSSGAMTVTRPLPIGLYAVATAVAGTQVLAIGGYDTNENPYPHISYYESSYCAGIAPCANGGTCVSGLTGYSCACPSGFPGPTCGSAANPSTAAAAVTGTTAAGGVTSTTAAAVTGTTGISAGSSVGPAAAVVAVFALSFATALLI